MRGPSPGAEDAALAFVRESPRYRLAAQLLLR